MTTSPSDLAAELAAEYVPKDPKADAELCWLYEDTFTRVFEMMAGRIEDQAIMRGVTTLFIARSRLITNG